MKKLMRMTNAELLQLQEQLCNDPKNKNDEGKLMLYNKKTQRKLEEIRHWIVANSILAKGEAA
jgi:hypothetical protein